MVVESSKQAKGESLSVPCIPGLTVGQMQMLDILLHAIVSRDDFNWPKERYASGDDDAADRAAALGYSSSTSPIDLLQHLLQPA